jgi:hypothetical protein
MSKHAFVLGLPLILFASGALAQVPGKGGKGADQVVEWEEFKDRCQNPMHYQEQVRPMNIIIQCTTRSTAWTEDAPGALLLPAHRLVTSAVFSHKFAVNARQEAVAAEPGTGSCTRFKEVEAMLTQEYAPSCDQILSNIKGTLTDFCAQALAGKDGQDGKGGKPDPKVRLRDTGRVVDTCAAVTGGAGGKPVGGKRG